MATQEPDDRIVVDIGNSFVKVARIDQWHEEDLDFPKVSQSFEMSPHCDLGEELQRWGIERHTIFYISSVNRKTLKRFYAGLDGLTAECSTVVVSHTDFSLPIKIDHPDRIGTDRLAAATAVNLLRNQRRAAIVVDAGSAITIDAVSREGAFLGGSILAGVRMSADVLAQGTDLLPWVQYDPLRNPPCILGTSTQSAILSGLFWGTLGAVREVVVRLSESMEGEVDLFVSGGDARRLTDFLPTARFVPQLVLSGIVIAARNVESRKNADRRTQAEG